MTDDGTACSMVDSAAASYDAVLPLVAEARAAVHTQAYADPYTKSFAAPFAAPCAIHPHVDDAAPYEFRLARSKALLRSAMQLVEHRYQDRGYREMTDAAPSLHAFANSELLTLTMSHYGDVCGTISIRFDGPHGLAADEVFPAEMRELRTSGMALCEFTKLALDIEETSRQVLAHLFHRAYLCAFRQHEAELMVIEVNPRHVAFYRRLLGFNVLSDVRMNPRVNAPAVLLSLSMVEAQQQIARYGGHGELGKVVRTLYPFSYSPQDEQALLDSLVH